MNNGPRKSIILALPGQVRKASKQTVCMVMAKIFPRGLFCSSNGNRSGLKHF
jgi:hypothetical protein